ncbi:glucose-6-phosphate dehydrogenase [Mycolicibacterium frederiksbergense]|uniref:glucose-6-phosphate dehydrogenase n=1 Tax=Mycolicibacterium frederiksbergense TaxID=117567 RepID=UPI00399A4B20
MNDYFGTMLRDCLDVGSRSSPQIARAQFPELITDDVRLHVLAGRMAAAEWGHTEAHAPVTVTATHIVATEHGLLYAAMLTAPHHAPWHYLAVPHALFDRIADRVHDAPPPSGAVAAVDCRLDHDLTSMWQFEAALRRMLDDYPAFELELSGAQ